jgi:prophage tail gpP-like protein
MANPVYPNPLEVAKLTTAYGEFTEWESVWVQHRWADSSALFRFTCAEFSPMPPRWDLLKLLPGDNVDIDLGGQPAMRTGIITDRQVGYDANSHGVELSGKSFSWVPATSSVDPPRSFDNMGVVDIARELFPKVVIVGSPNNMPNEHQQSQPHESKWDFLETIARPRGIVLGSDEFGNLLVIGDHTMPVSATLIEGVNILKMNCLISIENLYGVYGIVVQVQGHDDMSGAAVSQPELYATGTGPAGRVINTPSPSAMRRREELQLMALNEAKWSEGTRIQASVTVQGWMQPGTNTLWQAGQHVAVSSPMAVINGGTELKAQNVTFQQDRNSGTTTTLDLVVPWLLNGGSKVKGVVPIIPDPQSTIDAAGGFRGTIDPPQPPQGTVPTPPPSPHSSFARLRYRN